MINWVIAVEQYFERHLSQQKTKEFNRRDAGNKLRGALLNYHAKDGAMEYMDVRRLNERNEIIERQFQMPRRILTALQEKSEGNKEKESSSDDSNFEVIFHERTENACTMVQYLLLPYCTGQSNSVNVGHSMTCLYYSGVHIKWSRFIVNTVKAVRLKIIIHPRKTKYGLSKRSLYK